VSGFHFTNNDAHSAHSKAQGRKRVCLSILLYYEDIEQIDVLLKSKISGSG